MRHYLEIDGYTVPRVSRLNVKPMYRNETRKTTLSGGLAVDRGEEKLKLSARARILSTTEMKTIEAKLKKIFVSVKFYYRGEIVEKKMITSPISPKNSGYPNRSEADEVYTDVTIELEEQ